MAKKVRKTALEKMVEEAKRIEEKEKILAQIHQLYSKFGEHVLTIILDHAFKVQGCAILLKKLEILPPITREEQQQALLEYLNRNGPEQFLKAVRGSMLGSVGRTIALSGAGGGIASGSTTMLMGTVSAAKEPPPQPGLVERRSGKDRRRGKDRRGDIELIFKNLRFGGERRSGRERRKNWRPTK